MPIPKEKREPVSDIDIAVVDSLKVLDPNRPIREATKATGERSYWHVGARRKLMQGSNTWVMPPYWRLICGFSCKTTFNNEEWISMWPL